MIMTWPYHKYEWNSYIQENDSGFQKVPDATWAITRPGRKEDAPGTRPGLYYIYKITNNKKRYIYKINSNIF